MLKLIKRYEGMKYGNLKFLKPFSFTKIINNYNNSNLKYSSMFLFSSKLNKDNEVEKRSNPDKSDDTLTNSDISPNNLNKNVDNKIENEINSENITNKINTNTTNTSTLAIGQTYKNENKISKFKYLFNYLFSSDKYKTESKYLKYLNDKLENFKLKKSSGINHYNNLRFGKNQKLPFNIFSLKNKEMNIKKFNMTNKDSNLNLKEKTKYQKWLILKSKSAFYFIRRIKFQRNFNKLRLRQLVFSILIFMLFFYLCFGNYKKIIGKIIFILDDFKKILLDENVDKKLLKAIINFIKSINYKENFQHFVKYSTPEFQEMKNIINNLYFKNLVIIDDDKSIDDGESKLSHKMSKSTTIILELSYSIKNQLLNSTHSFFDNLLDLVLKMELFQYQFRSYFYKDDKKDKLIKILKKKIDRRNSKKQYKEEKLGDSTFDYSSEEKMQDSVNTNENEESIQVEEEKHKDNSVTESTKSEKESKKNKNEIKRSPKNITNEKDSEKADTNKVLLPTNISTQEFQVIKDMPERLIDVKGMTEIKDEIAEIVNMLKNPDVYQNAGAKMVRGILLMGKPGTGKTLLARALAGETNINFIFCNGADFDKTYVGQGSNAIRKLFKTARNNQPCIIFIDEIDSLIHKGRRSGKYSSSNDRSLINTFLSEMDGFSKRDQIFVMGATNSEKDLDKAATRPGRFDKLINVPLPDSKGREELFDFYIGKVSFN